jgi:hypothetical protein
MKVPVVHFLDTPVAGNTVRLGNQAKPEFPDDVLVHDK